MKKMIASILAVMTLVFVGSPAFATYAKETDYMNTMLQAAVAGDWDTGQNAQFGRNAKIDEEGLDYIKISFEDLYLLAKIIYAEAGSQWLPDDWKMCVGEVVLNRVDSPEFPNTIVEVIYQPGQYYGADSSYFAALNPDMRCAQLALRLLEGERVMNRPSVVFQANFRQGGGVHLSYYDEVLGWTYFCDSCKTNLYTV
ncbi:MAG: cell wall hydrolase [Oscillospiraceae bacterium]